jgi:hypothetical protein
MPQHSFISGTVVKTPFTVLSDAARYPAFSAIELTTPQVSLPMVGAMVRQAKAAEAKGSFDSICRWSPL